MSSLALTDIFHCVMEYKWRVSGDTPFVSAFICGPGYYF